MGYLNKDGFGKQKRCLITLNHPRLPLNKVLMNLNPGFMERLSPCILDKCHLNDDTGIHHHWEVSLECPFSWQSEVLPSFVFLFQSFTHIFQVFNGRLGIMTSAELKGNISVFHSGYPYCSAVQADFTEGQESVSCEP